MSTWTLEIHAVSERKFWKTAESGSVGIAVAMADGDGDPAFAFGCDPQSRHNSHSFIWAATESVRRIQPGPEDRLVIRGMHPLMKRAFDGKKVLHGDWLLDFKELRRELDRRFGDRWTYRHRPEMKGSPGFFEALRHGREGADDLVRWMGWPPELVETDSHPAPSANESLFDELFG